ncbi:MAG: hypothetical protein KF690_04155 [Bacteroidetes bacterium]|nr:hypothetical protein [Bacteroidota bacterium]
MKKNLLLLLTPLVLVSGAFAQNVDIIWGDLLKDKKYYVEDYAGIVGDDTYVLYAYRGNKYKFHLQKLNSRMKEVYSRDVDIFNPDEKNIRFETSYIMDGVIHYFSEYYDKKSNAHKLLLSQSDLEAKKEGSVMEMATITSNKKYNKGGFRVVPSPDSSMFLLYSDEMYRRNEEEKFSFRVVFRNMKDVIWEKSVSLPHKDKNTDMSQVQIDNMGNVYVLMRIYKERKERSRGQSTYYYKIVKLENPTGAVQEYELDLGEYYIEDAEMKVDLSNALVCTGFYAEKKRSDVTSGFFIVKLNGANGQILQKFVNKVDGLYPEKIKYSDKVPYYIRRMIPAKDGGLTVVAEQYELIISTYTDSKGNVRTVYHYYYMDVVVIALDKDGKLAWNCRIPKAQHTINDNGIFSSIIAAEKNGKVYIIYNDNKLNLDVYEDKKLKNMKLGNKSMAMMAVVQPGGQYKKYALFSKKDIKSYLRPKYYLDCKNGDVIIQAITAKATRIGRIVIN